MRAIGQLALALLLVLAVASPGLAGVAVIEATAPLQDHSKPAIEAAFKEAVKTAMRGAVAMGLPWVQVREAVVLKDMVAIRVLATDVKPDKEPGDPGPGGEPGKESGRPRGLDL